MTKNSRYKSNRNSYKDSRYQRTEKRQYKEGNSRRRKARQKRIMRAGIIILFAVLMICFLVILYRSLFKGDTKQVQKDLTVTQSETEETEEDTNPIPRPDIDVQLLTPNEYSRPQIPVPQVNGIVIHYIGNPMTSAQENHDFFESLKDLQTDYMSANFIIGLEGEIIQCVPTNEEAYASNERNEDTISIENCHVDETGKFNEATYSSLVKLVAYLCGKYELNTDQIIRHYDVTGKECPKYFVENEDEWELFKQDVANYMEEYIKE